MFELSKKDIEKYECIIWRRIKESRFSIQKLHDSGEDNYNPYFYFDLEEAVKHPLIVKDSKDKDELKNIKEENGKGFRIGIISNNSYETSTPIELHTRLVLDYDNKSSDMNLIYKFTKKFKDYSWILYTTFSHRLKRPKFRVIIELKYPIPNIYLENSTYQQYLSDLFSLGREKPDNSCFGNKQLQFLPMTSKPAIYKYEFNEGKQLELKSLEYVNKREENAVNEMYRKFKFPDLYKIYYELYGNKCKECIIDYKERKKKLARIKEFNKNNFNVTRKYKDAKKKLIQRTRHKLKTEFKNKFEFVKYYAALVVNEKITSVKAQNVFKKIYGKELSKCPKWYNDYQRCLRKFVKGSQK